MREHTPFHGPNVDVHEAIRRTFCELIEQRGGNPKAIWPAPATAADVYWAAYFHLEGLWIDEDRAVRASRRDLCDELRAYAAAQGARCELASDGMHRLLSAVLDLAVRQGGGGEPEDEELEQVEVAARAMFVPHG